MVDCSRMNGQLSRPLIGLLLALGAILVPCVASACSLGEKQKMRVAGFGDTRISQVCASNAVEHVACSSLEMQAMLKAGISGHRIGQLCASSVAQPSAATTRSSAASSNICRTAERSCTLGQSGSVGMACWCNSSYGPQRGALAAQ